MQALTINRRHVFMDLKPYSCTFPDCPTPSERYGSRRTWFQHELDFHRRVWQCNMDECRDSGCFDSMNMLKEHLLQTHHEFSGFDGRGLEFIADKSGAEASLDAMEKCVICQRTFTLRTLRRHLAKHMEQLALWILPRDVNGDDSSENEEGSNVWSLRAFSEPDDEESQVRSTEFGQAVFTSFDIGGTGVSTPDSPLLSRFSSLDAELAALKPTSPTPHVDFPHGHLLDGDSLDEDLNRIWESTRSVPGLDEGNLDVQQPPT